MSVTINARGTSVPYFKLGKTGSTLYQGTSDPTGSYTVNNGDVWFDTSSNLIKFRSTGSWVSGTGTVTNVSVTTANGISGTVSNSSTTPAITLTLGAITPTSVAATGSVSGINLSGTNTGDQTITLTGDVTGSGTGSFAATLATVNSSPQTDQFRKVTVNGKGLVTATSAVTTSDITALVDSTYVNVTGDTMTGALTIDQSGNQLTGRLIVGDQTTPSNTTSIYLRSTTGSYINYSSGGNLIFNADGSGTAEKMRLDSNGNLGIGVSPNGARLNINGGSLTTSTNGLSISGSLTAGRLISDTGPNINAIHTYYDGNSIEITAGSSGGAIAGITLSGSGASSAPNTARLFTGSTERLRIDANGLVGVGLTPVASNGILQLNSYASIKALLETATVTSAAPSSTTNFDLITQAVQYYTSNASTNFTLNVRGNSTTSLNTIMQTGQAATLSLLVTNGGTAYRPTAFQIDGNAVTPKWQGGTAPSAGNINSIDIYTLTIIKTASATFTVLATQTQFA